MGIFFIIIIILKRKWSLHICCFLVLLTYCTVPSFPSFNSRALKPCERPRGTVGADANTASLRFPGRPHVFRSGDGRSSFAMLVAKGTTLCSFFFLWKVERNGGTGTPYSKAGTHRLANALECRPLKQYKFFAATETDLASVPSLACPQSRRLCKPLTRCGCDS